MEKEILEIPHVPIPPDDESSSTNFLDAFKSESPIKSTLATLQELREKKEKIRQKEEAQFYIDFRENANDGQLLIFEDMLKHIKELKENGSSEQQIFSLIGSAGVGKTWLMSNIIKLITFMDLSVAVTTPTHTALGVAEDMIEKANIKYGQTHLSTIHSFLNLKLDYGFGADGSADDVSLKPRLVPNKFKECSVFVDVLFIDESSMVNADLYQLTLDVLNDRTRMIIFVGDEFQLKPVEGGDNIIYSNPEIIHYELTETVRQKEGSSIITYANYFRDCIKQKYYPPTINGVFNNTEEIQLLNDSEFLPLYFEDDDSKKIGAYTNGMVDQYNSYVRYMETKQLEYLIPGDRVVFQKPYSNAQGVLIFQNGEEVVVESAKKKTDLNGLTYWRCKGMEQFFNVLDPSSQTEFKDKLDILLNDAKMASGKARSNAWKKFFKLQTRYGSIKYAYASTLHKLQGSTKENIYFDMRDLGKFYRIDPDNVLRLIYVAITRASKTVFILEH